jgi:hypothetical protein
LPLALSVPLFRNPFSVPGQERIRRDDTGHFFTKLPAECLTLDGKPSSFVVRQTTSSPTKLIVLVDEVIAGGLRVPLVPTSHGDDPKFPRLEGSAHKEGF